MCPLLLQPQYYGRIMLLPDRSCAGSMAADLRLCTPDSCSRPKHGIVSALQVARSAIPHLQRDVISGLLKAQ